MLKRTACYLLTVLLLIGVKAQDKPAPSILTGNIIDENRKAVAEATVELSLMGDSAHSDFRTLSEKDGGFTIQKFPYGYYRMRISFVGFQDLLIDSIHFRPERSDFNLSDLVLKQKTSSGLGEVIVYAEKPLIQSKDGNITFNAAESALSAGSSASELLANVPLVTKDPDGKITVRGKEPKILIDDKPVELNLQQLQDLLESMPCSIGKIVILILRRNMPTIAVS
jgi:hypothetical protein